MGTEGKRTSFVDLAAETPTKVGGRAKSGLTEVTVVAIVGIHRAIRDPINKRVPFYQSKSRLDVGVTQTKELRNRSETWIAV